MIGTDSLGTGGVAASYRRPMVHVETFRQTLKQIRDAQKAKFVGGAVPAIQRTTARNQALARIQPFTRAEETFLSVPEAPSTSWPVRKWQGIDVSARHDKAFPRLPDRGAAPGVYRAGLDFHSSAGSALGSLVRRLPEPRLAGSDETPRIALLDKVIPAGIVGAKTVVKSAARDVRLKLLERITPVNLGSDPMAHPTGLQVAQAPRLVPDTPSGTRGALRDLRPRVERGLMYADSIAPAHVSAQLAQKRGANISASALDPPTANRTGDSTERAPSTSAGAPTASSAPAQAFSMGGGALALLAVAALVLFRR